MGKRKFAFEIGAKFNHFTVVGEIYSVNKSSFCKFECVCGNIKDRKIYEIMDGRTKSCGCKNKEYFIENNPNVNKRPIDENGYKICHICLINKHRSDFNKRHLSLDKLDSRCKQCAKFLRIKRAYKLTIEEYLEMFKKQNNKCAICFKDYGDKLFVDHCHTTGKIRGLLCSMCNSGIGYFDENIQNIKNSISYLEKHKS